MSKKKYLLLFITVLTVSIIIFYPSFQYLWQPPKYPVLIAVSKSPLSTPFYIAKAINAFENTCVSVEYDDVIGGQLAFDKVMSSDVDFGTSSDSVIAFQSLTKKSFVTHVTFVQSDNDLKLLTRKADKISTVIDLKGKNIGVTKGTASEYFLSTLLAIDGLSIEDVELYDYKPEELVNGFAMNEVEAIVPWEPFAFNVVERFNDQISVHDTKNFNTINFNLISKKADDLLVKKAACVIQGLNTAIAYIALHPEQSKTIVREKLNLTPSFIDWVWSDYIFKLGLNQSLILNIKSQAAWAIETQMSKYKVMPNVDAYLDKRAMLQVEPEAVNIPL